MPTRRRTDNRLVIVSNRLPVVLERGPDGRWRAEPGSGGRSLVFFLADVVPTAAHIDLPAIMSYDLYPVLTFDNKKALLERAADGGWTLGFGHELRHPFGTIRREGRRLVFVPAGGPENG